MVHVKERERERCKREKTMMRKVERFLRLKLVRAH